MATQERVLAELGAVTRLEQLHTERMAILKVFPHLAGTGQGPKRKVSKAARAAMSEGMRKFWARRKAGAKKQS